MLSALRCPPLETLAWLCLIAECLASSAVAEQTHLPIKEQQQDSSRPKPFASQPSNSKVYKLYEIMRSNPGVLTTSGNGPSSGGSSSSSNIIQQRDDIKCAQYCYCSLVQVENETTGLASNLSLARCESPQFSDVLSIDRRTQVIHISLRVDESSGPSPGVGGRTSNKPAFRMPRLVQFTQLKEMMIINFKLQVCETEVFKRGQRIRRLQLNYNKLERVSKSCFKHLDKLIELSLDHNELEELESALFSSLLSLRTLSIAHNRLSELAAHQFANLSRLISLNLVGNSFKTINLHLFEPMQASLRLLMLADNEIKTFTYAPPSANQNIVKLLPQQAENSTKSNLLGGLVFKNLLKLDVNKNKFERIKMLQLHRFYNIKYLYIMHNSLATIRDKAFNGLKLIELNMAHNQLQSISKCAFCNATIKRLVLSNNNISIPISAIPLDGAAAAAQALAAPLVASESYNLPEPQAQVASEPPPPPSAGQQSPQQQNMLILSHSIFGPLFSHLEYVDLSYNQQLASQLEFLLEPLLKLEYLNLASVGFEGSLPSPTLFKNLRQLRYLNLSSNQLDLLVSETVDPLTALEVLDLSNNKFSEIDESLLVSIDDLASLRLVNFASNPWFCSQCKVAHLHDWVQRSAIYNMTCTGPLLAAAELSTEESSEADQPSLDDQPHESTTADDFFFNLLVSGDDDSNNRLGNPNPSIDFDLVLGNAHLDDAANYNLASDVFGSASLLKFGDTQTSSVADSSISETLALLNQLAQSSSDLLMTKFEPKSYCLRCEYPRELRSFYLHDLSSSDFKFCPGVAPRSTASEPKLGLTLALVIIGALFCIIIVVIIMYRRKSNNTYYIGDADTDKLKSGGAKRGGTRAAGGSNSSDMEQQYGGDATDYSSPPMSQSYSGDSYEDEDEEIDEDVDEVEEEEPEDEDVEDIDEEEVDELEKIDDDELEPERRSTKRAPSPQPADTVSRSSRGTSNQRQQVPVPEKTEKALWGKQSSNSSAEASVSSKTHQVPAAVKPIKPSSARLSKATTHSSLDTTKRQSSNDQSERRKMRSAQTVDQSAQAAGTSGRALRSSMRAAARIGSMSHKTAPKLAIEGQNTSSDSATHKATAHKLKFSDGDQQVARPALIGPNGESPPGSDSLATTADSLALNEHLHHPTGDNSAPLASIELVGDELLLASSPVSGGALVVGPDSSGDEAPVDDHFEANIIAGDEEVELESEEEPSIEPDLAASRLGALQRKIRHSHSSHSALTQTASSDYVEN